MKQHGALPSGGIKDVSKQNRFTSITSHQTSRCNNSYSNSKNTETVLTSIANKNESEDVIYSVVSNSTTKKVKESSEQTKPQDKGTNSLRNKAWVVLIIILVIFTLILVAATGLLINEIFSLKKSNNLDSLESEVLSVKTTAFMHRDQLMANQQVINSLISNVTILRYSLEQLCNSIVLNESNTLHSHIENMNATYTKYKKNILKDMVELNATKLFRYESEESTKLMIANITAATCDTICQYQNCRDSGSYWIRSPNGSSVLVYCNMTTLCNRTGGWRRVVKLEKYNNGRAACFPDLVNNRTNASQCVKNGTARGCSHTVFPLHNIEYTHVCGVVEGYGYRSPDGFCTAFGIDNMRTNYNNINGNFVDGISFTYQLQDVKNELWTFRASTSHCGSPPIPNFLHEEYISYLPILGESGSTTSTTCLHGTCVDTFHREFPQPISSDIEMRLCRGQPELDEEIIIGNVEIYVL